MIEVHACVPVMCDGGSLFLFLFVDPLTCAKKKKNDLEEKVSSLLMGLEEKYS